MNPYTIIIIIFGIITMCILCLLFFINRLSLLKNEIENSFIPIKDYIEERITLLDKISSFITNNLEHEEELTKKINKEKNNLSNINNAIDGIPTLKNTEEVFTKFNNLNKTYQKLTNNKEYLSLKEEYKENENRIKYAADSYDKGVKKYNNYKENKFTLSKLLKFPKYSYYKKEL